MKYYIDPFGCAKNQVDAENIMAILNSTGWSVSDPDKADLIIINSCGFIESAKQESINAVLASRRLYPEKKILLAGCLSQRYGRELAQALPEADALFGNGDLAGIAEAAARLMGEKPKKAVRSGSPGQRPLLSLPGSAYIKISEGCNNRCSYCAIPNIRGDLKSRSIGDLQDECRILLDRGVKELCLVGQDLGSYGMDSGTPALPELMEAVSKIKGEYWVRLLYIHPDHFPLPILDLMKSDSRFLTYFDLPFQHASERILRLMNRRGNAEAYLSLIETIRRNLPDAVIRSTFLTGFPGEAGEDFQELLDFQKAACLDWLGCFTYSREEDTPAFSMKPRIGKKTAGGRKRILEECQVPITEKQMYRFIGRSFDVLIEEKVEGEEGLWLGRLPCQAPEVDGCAVISSDRELNTGEFVRGYVFAQAGLDLEVQV